MGTKNTSYSGKSGKIDNKSGKSNSSFTGTSGKIDKSDNKGVNGVSSVLLQSATALGSLTVSTVTDTINISGKTLRNGESYTTGSGRKITLNLKDDIDLTSHQPLYPFIELSIGGVVISDFGDNISDCVVDFQFDRSTSADAGFAASKFTITVYDDTALEIEEILYAGMDTRDYTSGASTVSYSSADGYETSSLDATRQEAVAATEKKKKDNSKKTPEVTRKNYGTSYNFRTGNDEPLGPHGMPGVLGASKGKKGKDDGFTGTSGKFDSSPVGQITNSIEKAVEELIQRNPKAIFDGNIDRWKTLTESQLDSDKAFDYFRTVSGISPKAFKSYVSQGKNGIDKMRNLYYDRLPKFSNSSSNTNTTKSTDTATNSGKVSNADGSYSTGEGYANAVNSGASSEVDVKNIEVCYGWANNKGKKIVYNTIKGNYTKYQIDFEEGTVNLTIEGTVQSMVQAGNVKSEYYDGNTYNGSPSKIVQHICEAEGIPIGKIENTESIVGDDGNPKSFTRNNCSADRFIVNKLCEEATSAETGTVGFVFFIGEDNKAYFVATNRVGELGVKAKQSDGVDRSSYGVGEKKGKNLGYYNNSIENSFRDYDKPLGASSSTGQSTGTRDVIIVGDSRTNIMRIHSHGGGNGVYYDDVNSEGVRVICHGGKGIAWLKSTAIPKLDKYVKNGTRVVFWLGVNDCYREYSNMAGKYADALNPKIQEWLKRGAIIYYATIGPVKGVYTLNGYHLDDTSINSFTNGLKSQLKGVGWIDAYSLLRKHNDSELFQSDKIHYYSKSVNMELYNFFVSSVSSGSSLANSIINNFSSSIVNRGSGVYENIDVPENLEITGYYEYNSGKRNNKVISFSPEYKDIVLTAKSMLPSNVYSVDPLKNQMFECTMDHGEKSDVMNVVKDKKYLVMGMSSASYSKLEKVAQSMYDRYQTSMYDATLEIMGDPNVKVFKWIYVAIFTKHGFLHHSSGIYFIKSASDSLSRGEFVTTLSLQKLGSEQTMNLGKQALEAVVQSDSAVIGNSDIRAVSGEWSWPLPSGYTRVSSPFGARSKSLSSDGFHSGIDIPAPSGTEILASKAGTVYSITRNNSQIGNSVTLKHEGNPVSYSLYHHMSRIGNISNGQSIAQGQVIGYVGTTGHSTGNHLHFEIRVGGNRRGTLNNTDCVDPQNLLTKPG